MLNTRTSGGVWDGGGITEQLSDQLTIPPTALFRDHYASAD